MPDIRRLVENIAQAMGPHTPPERIEVVAAAVLDALAESDAPSSPLLAPKSGERAIITAFGMDHPGILAEVTQAVSDAGCNILDVSQKILQGYFTLMMLADITPMRGSMQDLQSRLNTVAERLGVRVLAQHEDLFQAMHRP